MRTPLLAGFLAILLPACLAGEITDVGGDDIGDGSGSGSGSGDGSGSNTPTPRLSASLDKTTVTTELGKTEMVTLTLTSEGGFAGDVAITSRLVDMADTALPNITLMGPPTVSLTDGGTQTAQFQIQVPTNATGSTLNGSLKLELTSSLGAQALTSLVTVNNIYTVDYAMGTGATVANHANITGTHLIKRGAIIRFHNSDTTEHIIHGNAPFPHEDTGNGGSPGRDYDIETIGIAPGTEATMGCHTHGTSTYSAYRIE